MSRGSWVVGASLLDAVGHGCSVLGFVGREGSLGHEQHQAQRTIVSLLERCFLPVPHRIHLRDRCADIFSEEPISSCRP